MVESHNGIYIAWNVFEDYASLGSLAVKETVLYAINRLLGSSKTLSTNLPAQGVVTLMEQKQHNRYVNHLLYVTPVKRGKSIEVIEDVIPLHDVEVSLRLPSKVSRIYLAPQLQEIPFEQDGDKLTYTVSKLDLHQMIVLDIDKIN
ncbi:hypothetical protein D3C85_1348760 [compost metagenome]